MSRSGLLLGPEIAGSVACFQAFETCPSMPPGALASSRMATAGTMASAPISTRLARARVRGRGRVDVGQEADREPGGGQRRPPAAGAARPRPWPASMRSAIVAPSVVSPSCANAHTTSGTVATSTPPSAIAARSRSGTSANQHASTIPSASSAPREYRQQQADDDDAEPRPGERVERRVAGAPRGEPQQRRDADRRRQADAVPVVERRPQARERLVRRERGGEDLGQQRPGAERDDPRSPRRRSPRSSGRARAARARARRPARPGRRASGWSRATSRWASATT